MQSFSHTDLADGHFGYSLIKTSKTNYDSQKWTSELRRFLFLKLPTNQGSLLLLIWGITKGFITYGVEKIATFTVPNFPSPRLRMTLRELLQGFGRFFLLLKPTPLFSASCEKLREVEPSSPPKAPPIPMALLVLRKTGGEGALTHTYLFDVPFSAGRSSAHH